MAVGRDARHSAQIKAANQARDAAIRILIERHRAEYDEIHAVEAESRGVKPRTSTKVKSKSERLEDARRGLAMTIPTTTSVTINMSSSSSSSTVRLKNGTTVPLEVLRERGNV